MTRMALLWMARQRVGGTKGKNDNDRFTLQNGLGKLGEQKVLTVVKVDLSSDSICSLAFFSQTDFALSQ